MKKTEDLLSCLGAVVREKEFVKEMKIYRQRLILAFTLPGERSFLRAVAWLLRRFAVLSIAKV